MRKDVDKKFRFITRNLIMFLYSLEQDRLNLEQFVKKMRLNQQILGVLNADNAMSPNKL